MRWFVGLDVDGRRRNDLKDLFDLSQFDSYKEDNRREVKKANGGLPVALWDSYSLLWWSNHSWCCGK
jgi:hypothetical protein